MGKNGGIYIEAPMIAELDRQVGYIGSPASLKVLCYPNRNILAKMLRPFSCKQTTKLKQILFKRNIQFQ